MNLTELKSRREKLVKELNGAVAVVQASSHKVRSNDTEFPYRESSNFFYLTGIAEPGAFLVITPKGDKTLTTLFVREKDPKMELWTGIRLGTDKAKEVTGVDQCFLISEFDEVLPKLIVNHDTLAFDFHESTDLFPRIVKAIKKTYRTTKPGQALPIKTVDLHYVVGKQRLIKSEYELELMRKGAVITDKAHRAAMALAAPGKNEKDLHNTMDYIFRGHGGDGDAYDSIVATGENGLILHYVENDAEIKDGDTLLIDAGCQFNMYATDVTRTFPANGKFTEAQKEIYEACLKAQLSALNFAGPGKTLVELHDHTVEVLVDEMISMGILNGTRDEIIEKKDFKKYYPHGTGHWLGMDVHDQTPYFDDDFNKVKLEPGMCFTVEPGIYVPKDDIDVPEKYRGLSVRIEDDIVITKEGIENLTSSIPKSVEEVEAACAKDYKEFLP